jgi:hypothetical protein
MGESQSERQQIGQDRSHPGKADTLGGRTKEDRSGAEGAMGEGEGGEEDGLIVLGHLARLAVMSIREFSAYFDESGNSVSRR